MAKSRDPREIVEELDRANAFLDSIVENIPDMIFVKDAKELRFERFNRAGEALLGKPRGELLGKSDFDFFPPEQAAFFQAKDRQALAGGVVVDVPEEPIETPRGVRILHTKKIPILDERGTPKYLLGISEDITERKAAEAALARAHAELEQRVAERTAELHRSEAQLRQAQKMEAVGRLAGGVAHDFNNMLTVILSQASMLRARRGADHATQQAVDEIIDAARRAATLTTQLLAFSRQQILQPRHVDLDAVVAGVEPMLRRLIGEDIDLRLTRAGRPAWVHADPGQLEQVIVNLVVNARDAMPHGGALHLRVGVVGERQVRFEVADTGVGMDAETAGRVFEPFFTTKARGHGAGLGLATVYGIVTQSGGAITVDSEPGRGTRFVIDFPLTGPEPGTAAASAPAPVVEPKRETVLLVEDEDAVRRAVRACLVGDGYTVLEARDGIEALRTIGEYRGTIQIVLTDLIMPGMHGRELARRAAEVLPGVRIMFMTGYAQTPGTPGLAPGAAAEALIMKPFDPDALSAALRRLMEAPARKA